MAALWLVISFTLSLARRPELGLRNLEVEDPAISSKTSSSSTFSLAQDSHDFIEAKPSVEEALQQLLNLVNETAKLTISDVLDRCNDSPKPIFLTPSFNVICKDKGKIQIIAIKSKTSATIDALNVALQGLPDIQQLILDGSNVSGHLKSLRVQKPSKLVRLHMRWCRVEGDLEDLQMYSFEALKLSGSQIHGDLQNVNLTRLQFLDLRGTAVKGDLSSLHGDSSLRGLWLQETNVRGDIMQILQKHPKLVYLHLGYSQVYGTITDQGKEQQSSGSKLKELGLQHVKVKFNMSGPEGCKKKTPLAFPDLITLDVSGSSLDMDVWAFLYPFAKCNIHISEVAASQCGLSGTLKGMSRAENFPLMWKVHTLDLSQNNITALEGEPRKANLDLRYNPSLTTITKNYFGGTQVLDLRHTHYNGTAAASQAADASILTPVKPMTNGSWTCKGVKPSTPGGNDSIVLVTPEIFAPEELCTCAEGFAGLGINCMRCINGSTSLQGRRCCGCPSHTARVDFEHGKVSGNSTSTACLACHGMGCIDESCDNNTCAVGYSGILCGSCVQGYEQRSSLESHLGECRLCEDAVHWSNWAWLGAYGVALCVAMVYLIFMQKPKEMEADRKTEFIEQGVFLLSVIQILKTTQIAMNERLNSPVQMKFGDLLMWVSVQCGALGYENGRILEALSSAFFLPLLCLLGLLVGAKGCLRSPLYGVKFCIIMTSALYVGTIQATVSNFMCTSHDKNDIPLMEASFLKEFPFVACEGSGPLHISLYVALVLNGAVIPGSLLFLAFFVTHQTAKVRDHFRLLQPACSPQFVEESGIVKVDFQAPERDESEESYKHQSLLIYMASYTIHACEAIECTKLELNRIENGLSVVMKVKEGSNFAEMSKPQKKMQLWDVGCKSMWLSDVLVNRQSAKKALEMRPALWSGVKSSFLRYGALDPLLSEGLSKILIFVLTTLCAQKATLPLAGLLLLAGALGVFRGMPLGSRFRNHFAAACLALLGLFTFVMPMLDSSSFKWILPIMATVMPSLFFVHLQLLRADETLQVYELMDAANKFLSSTEVKSDIELPTGTWAFENRVKVIGSALDAYRSLWNYIGSVW